VAQRRRRSGGRRSVAGVLLAVSTLLAACDEDPTTEPGPARDEAVVVASFSFAESDLLAEIYAQALEAAGVPVRRELDLGSRELVLPALEQGQVDVVPEYLGTALAGVSGARTPTAPDARDVPAVRAALDQALRPWHLQTLTPSAAQNQNGLVVTQETARRLGLRTVSDLHGLAARLTLAGPPECRVRTYCLPGLRQRYGLRFENFLPLDTEGQRDAALDQGLADVAVLFTTDGRLAAGDLVLLADDRHLQPAENVVPVVSTKVLARHDGLVRLTLDRVSAQLTTKSLLFLNWRVTVAGKDLAGEARGWLRRHGLVTASR
jgi:osmoprotectant transport system substrate-binding protein